MSDNKKEVTILDDVQDSLGRLIKQGTFIPDWLKIGYLNGLSGKKIPSRKKINNCIKEEFWLNDIEKFSHYGFHLSYDEKKDYENAKGMSEVIVSTSLRSHYGWSLPSEETLSQIITYIEENNVNGLIEIGAGSGLWSELIRKRTQKEIIACELNLRKDTPKPKYGNVINKDGLELLKENPNHGVLIVWPDTNDIAFKIASELKENDILIIIGTVGVTGNDDFYKLLDNQFDIEENSTSVSFTGIENEKCFILKKRLNPKKIPNDVFQTEREKFKPKFNFKIKK